jgi:hypothetical protein
MGRRIACFAGTIAILIAAAVSHAEIKTIVDHNDAEHANADFKFERVPAPSKADAGAEAKFTLIDGASDENGGGISQLNNGQLPAEVDQPDKNFFFAAGTDGGRIGVDLGHAIDIKQVNSYSWHPGTRGPQVYKLYASDGSAAGFKAAPRHDTDPATCGWKLIVAVDTRPKAGEPGGQYGVSIADPDSAIGKYRYLLFDVSQTEADDAFGNTFFSEIDIIDRDPPLLTDLPATRPALAAGKYEITIDTTATPDLSDWADGELRPVLEEWYPKIVEMFPSDGYEAPKRFTVQFRADKDGVADTAGTHVNCYAKWFRGNLKGEARGAVVHELVHVVQQYGRVGRRSQRNPGWLVEGVADYVRWYKYEPQSHGADIRDPSRVHYNDAYRPTANFLNWVSGKYDKDLVVKLNTAMRQGKYSDDLWKEYTGKSADELGDEWKKSLEN